MVSGSLGSDLERLIESIGNPERYSVAVGSNAAVCCLYRSTRLLAYAACEMWTESFPLECRYQSKDVSINQFTGTMQLVLTSAWRRRSDSLSRARSSEKYIQNNIRRHLRRWEMLVKLLQMCKIVF